jgi:deoxycytidine triphosphate deaminase
MFLSKQRIRERCSGADSIFASSTFKEENLRQSSYDLRLGKESYVVGDDVPRRLSENEPYLIVSPGQFALF